MRFEVNCAKSHHRVISDGLILVAVVITVAKCPVYSGMNVITHRLTRAHNGEIISCLFSA